MRTAGFLAALLILACGHARGEDLIQAQPGSSRSPPNFESGSTISLEQKPHGIWDGGDGMRQGTMEAEAVFGAGLGIRDGGAYAHNIALAELRVGRVVSRLFGEGHWYQGNFEILGELFVGSQINHVPRYFVGFTPVLRYEFVTGSPWIPFIDGGAGITATDIGHPDLGANFEFCLQAGPGVKYYFRDNAAIIFQYRYFHMSNAGLYIHNKGINVNVLLLGASWSF